MEDCHPGSSPGQAKGLAMNEWMPDQVRHDVIPDQACPGLRSGDPGSIYDSKLEVIEEGAKIVQRLVVD